MYLQAARVVHPKVQLGGLGIKAPDLQVNNLTTELPLRMQDH